MDRTRIRTGEAGEKLAEKFIRSRGFVILDRNVRTPFGEIDLVAEDNGVLVFLEVKTRVSERRGPPLASITALKRRHIIRNAVYYLRYRACAQRACRIDAIGIILARHGKMMVLKHVRNAIQLRGDYNAV